MEADTWTRFSAPSKRHQSTLQSRFDLLLGFDDDEGGGGGGGDDDSRAEFACPFCAEDFDIVGLCCHIDEEHPVEAKNGICPVCAARVGMDMVSHITTQHGNIFKMQRRRRFRRGSLGAHSAFSLLRKEQHEGNLQSPFGGSSFTFAPSNAAPDPLLSSFITNLPVADPLKEELETLDDRNMVNEASEEKAKVRTGFLLSIIPYPSKKIYRVKISICTLFMDIGTSLGVLFGSNSGPNQIQIISTQPTLSDKDQEERAQRSEFVQELVLSTICENML